MIFLEILAETVGMIVFLLLSVLGFGEWSLFSNKTDESRRLMVLFGWLIVGGLIGYGSHLVMPRGVFPSYAIPGVSVIFVPILTGLAMAYWGKSRRRRGEPVPALTSFLGGWLFAFAFTLVRFISVRYGAA